MSNPRLKLRISDDEMTVVAEVVPGPPCSLSELQEALREAAATFMVSAVPLQALARQLSDGGFASSEVVVAQGRPARPGVDGHFEPAFPVGIQPGHLNLDGTMDFLDRDLLKPIAKGAYLGKLHQPQEGTTGCTVTGRALPVPAVRACKLRCGPGVSMAADGRMHAARAGVLVYSEDQTIDVAQQHLHSGDVDLRSGNLRMDGSIRVQGSVQRQFVVYATGNVEVQGHVESGSVLSGGAVRVDGRVRGGDLGQVCAEGDVSMRHAEGAHVRCGGLLKAVSAVNSYLEAGKIQVLGTLRGGKAVAEISVVVFEAGSERAGTPTLVAAGIRLERPLSDVSASIKAGKHERTYRRGGVRDASMRGKGGKSSREKAALDQQAIVRKAEFARRRASLLSQASVQVLKAAYPGVTIQLGFHSLQLDEAVAGARFVYDGTAQCIRKERPIG